jgi:holo-[acyl-carrier protein] synthase
MSVYSIGVDIAEVERLRKMIDRHGDRFLKRVYTAREIEYCRPKVSYAQNFAARFAAKEAVFKAAGTGLRVGMHWREVEVVNDHLGKPSVALYGTTAKLLEGKQVYLSLSHTDQIATAMVVVENKD